MQTINQIDQYLKRLFPINRSITGCGNRETLEILKEIIPLKTKEYKSGAKVFDWVIPDEWNINDAWIKDESGNRIVDFKKSNLHVVSYSEPVSKLLKGYELKSKLYLSKDFDEAIPYRTSYYHRDWGFCVTKEQYKRLTETDETFEVYIDSEFISEGELNIGELVIPGLSDQEILISTYFCHPSLANDNLSGVILNAFLAKNLLNRLNLKYSYRFIWVPETIGAIAYCYFNSQVMKNIDLGLVITSVGGPGKFSYKQSWDPNHYINKYIEDTLSENDKNWDIYTFDIHGSDERQYSSLGYRINVATISKDKYYQYPEYHTSLDNLDFVKAEYIYDSLLIYNSLINKIEERKIYKNINPNCEVMLSKYDLYPKRGGAINPDLGETSELDLILWLLFLCDGKKPIKDISRKLGIKDDMIHNICKQLVDVGLLIEV